MACHPCEDEAGFMIRDLAPGKYHIEVIPSALRLYKVTYYKRTIEKCISQTVEVKQGQITQGVNIILVDNPSYPTSEKPHQKKDCHS